jgi:hypothetical protein
VMGEIGNYHNFITMGLLHTGFLAATMSESIDITENAREGI